MNESVKNKNIVLARGKVSQDGYPDSECIFVKPLENRYDDIKDKPLYIVNDSGVSAPFYVVTPNVLEALNRVERKTLGVITINGGLVIPMIHSSVTKVSEEYYACNKSNSSEELEEMKDDPIKAQENAGVLNEIKSKMRTKLGSEIDFVCNSGKNSIYKISQQNDQSVCDKVYDNVSIVAVLNDAIYAHTNNVLDDVITVKESLTKTDSNSVAVSQDDVDIKSEVAADTNVNIGDDVKIVEPTHINMPVERFASIQPKPLDSLDGLDGSLEAVKDDAPKLIEDEDDIERKVETDYSNKTTIFSDRKADVKDEEYTPRISRSDDTLTVVPQIVGAIKDRLNESENTIERLQEDISGKDIDIRKLKEKLDLQSQKIGAQDEKIRTMQRDSVAIKDENARLRESNENLKDENERLKDTLNQVVDEFKGFISIADSDKVGYHKVA